MNYLIGFSKDIHLLAKKNTRPLILGGVYFDDINYEIVAHSDGDIIFHAISNSILSALALDEIGYYFSDQEKKNKNINSKEILDFSLKMMNDRKYKFNNIVIQIFTNQIMINKIKPKILSNLKHILNIEHISLSGSRFEKKSNHIECYCNLSLIKDNNEN